MSNYHNDYVAKYNSLETIKLINEIKKELKDVFNSKFNLLEIDPKIVSNTIIDNGLRTINFDNALTQSINHLNNNLNFYLFDKLNSLDLKVNHGLICYSHIIHRDFIPSTNITNYEFVYYVAFKMLIIDINLENIKKIVIDLIDDINSMKIIDTKAKKIKKIKVLTAQQIYKQFPIIKQENLLQEVVLRYHSVLIISPHFDEQKNVHFIQDNIMYGSFVATLFVYNETSNSILKILTIYSNAKQKDLYEKMINNDIDINLYETLKNKLNEYSNQIGIEFYFDQFLVYCLSKFSIDEIID